MEVFIALLTSLSTKIAWFCTIKGSAPSKYGQGGSWLLSSRSSSVLLAFRTAKTIAAQKALRSLPLKRRPCGLLVSHVTARYPNAMWQFPAEAPGRLAGGWGGTFPLGLVVRGVLSLASRGCSVLAQVVCGGVTWCPGTGMQLTVRACRPEFGSVRDKGAQSSCKLVRFN